MAPRHTAEDTGAKRWDRDPWVLPAGRTVLPDGTGALLPARPCRTGSRRERLSQGGPTLPVPVRPEPPGARTQVYAVEPAPARRTHRLRWSEVGTPVAQVWLHVPGRGIQVFAECLHHADTRGAHGHAGRRSQGAARTPLLPQNPQRLPDFQRDFGGLCGVPRHLGSMACAI